MKYNSISKAKRKKKQKSITENEGVKKMAMFMFKEKKNIDILPSLTMKEMTEIILKAYGYNVDVHSDHTAFKFLKKYGITGLISFKQEQKKILSDSNEKYLKSKKFLESDEWLKLRFLAFKKYGNKCQCCGISPKEGAILHVDHIKPRSLFPELATNIKNLQILCRECNLGKSNHYDADFR